MLRRTVDLIKSYVAEAEDSVRKSDIDLGVEWPNLLKFARDQWVSPIIYKAIERRRLDLPNEIVSAFRNDYYLSASRNALLLRDAEHVIETLDRAGIDVIVMRGASWAETLYGDVALRPMVDVDLLIQSKKIQDVPHLMRDLGYRLKSTVDYCAQFQHEQSGSLIEVHWAIGSGSECFAVDFETLWSHRRPLRLGNNVAHQLSLEDAISLASLHIGFQHCFAVKLIGYLDAYLLAGQPNATRDWGAIMRRAVAFKLPHLVFAVLDLTSRIFCVPFPSEAMECLRAHSTRFQLRAVESFDPSEVLSRSTELALGGDLEEATLLVSGRPSAFSPTTRFFWTYQGRDKLRLLKATLRTKHALRSPPMGVYSRTGLLLRRAFWLIRAYAWPLAKLTLRRLSRWVGVVL